jgi:hypothetical protein
MFVLLTRLLQLCHVLLSQGSQERLINFMKVGFLLGVLGQAQLLQYVVFEKQRILSHFVGYMQTLLLLHRSLLNIWPHHVATEEPAGCESFCTALAHQTRWYRHAPS